MRLSVHGAAVCNSGVGNKLSARPSAEEGRDRPRGGVRQRGPGAHTRCGRGHQQVSARLWRS